MDFFSLLALNVFHRENQMERLRVRRVTVPPNIMAHNQWCPGGWRDDRIWKSSLWEVASRVFTVLIQVLLLLLAFWVMLRRHDWHHVMEKHAGFMGASNGCPTYKRTQKVWNGTVFVWHSGESLGGCEGEVGRRVGSGWKKGEQWKCKREKKGE